MNEITSMPNQQSGSADSLLAEAGGEKKTFSPETAQWWKVLNAGHIGFDKILEKFLDNAVSARAKIICITLRQVKKKRFVLTVEDDGDGIAETVLPETMEGDLPRFVLLNQLPP